MIWRGKDEYNPGLCSYQPGVKFPVWEAHMVCFDWWACLWTKQILTSLTLISLLQISLLLKISPSEILNNSIFLEKNYVQSSSQIKILFCFVLMHNGHFRVYNFRSVIGHLTPGFWPTWVRTLPHDCSSIFSLNPNYQKSSGIPYSKGKWTTPSRNTHQDNYGYHQKLNGSRFLEAPAIPSPSPTTSG